MQITYMRIGTNDQIRCLEGVLIHIDDLIQLVRSHNPQEYFGEKSIPMDERIQYPSWSGMKRRDMAHKGMHITAALDALANASLPNLARALLRPQEYLKTPDLPNSISCDECNQTISSSGGPRQALQYQRNTQSQGEMRLHTLSVSKSSPRLPCLSSSNSPSKHLHLSQDWMLALRIYLLHYLYTPGSEVMPAVRP